MCVAFVLTLLVVACGSKPIYWMEGDRVLGTISIEEEEGEQGVFKYTYHDLAGRIARIERRDGDDRLVPRFAIVSYAYDRGGELEGIRFSDAEGRLRIGPPGYARLEIERRTTPAARIEDRIYYDPDGARMRIPAGYSRRETVVSTPKPGMQQRFFDEQDRAVCAMVDEVPDVCEVRFNYLRGVTPLTYKTLFSADGDPIRKTRISGLIELDTSTIRTRASYGDLEIQIQETRRSGN